VTINGVVRGLAALGPMASFRVYCDRRKRGKFYQVVILRRQDQVPMAAKLLSGRERGFSSTVGYCYAMTVQRRTRRGWQPSRLAGFVILAFNRVGSGYVSHEMTHAAHFRLIRAARRGMANVPLCDERIIEPLADLQGWLVAQFWAEFYKRYEGQPIVVGQG
jgi:hypothetical protein